MKFPERKNPIFPPPIYRREKITEENLMCRIFHKLIAFLLALQLGAAPVALAVDVPKETCVVGSSGEPPFFVSDNYLMGNASYENFRDLKHLNRVQSYIPKRTLVRVLPQEEQRLHRYNGGGRFMGVEVLGLPKGAKVPAGRLAVRPGEKGFIHYQSLVRPEAGVAIPRMRGKRYIDPRKEANFIFQVKGDSPFFPLIDDGKIQGGDVLRLVTVGEPGEKRFKTEECCVAPQKPGERKQCRTKYFFRVDQGGSVGHEIAFDPSGACSVVNVLEAKTATEIRQFQRAVQRTFDYTPPSSLRSPPPPPKLSELAPASGSPSVKLEVSAPPSTIFERREASPPPAIGRRAEPVARRAEPEVKRAEESMRRPAALLAAQLAPQIAEAGPRLLARCRGCRDYSANLVGARLGAVLQKDIRTWFEAPFNSVHYRRNARESNLAQGESMCAFLKVLDLHNRTCRGPGCKLIWGHFYSHPNEGAHNGHGTAQCVDVSPLRDFDSYPGGYAGIHAVGYTKKRGVFALPGYDRAKTQAFITLARSQGATNIGFCDRLVGVDWQDCKKHNDHIHMCFRSESGRLPTDCTQMEARLDTNVPLDACYANLD